MFSSINAKKGHQESADEQNSQVITHPTEAERTQMRGLGMSMVMTMMKTQVYLLYTTQWKYFMKNKHKQVFIFSSTPVIIIHNASLLHQSAAPQSKNAVSTF